MNEVERPLSDEKRAGHEEILLVRYHDSTQTKRSLKQLPSSTTRTSSRRTFEDQSRRANIPRDANFFSAGGMTSAYGFSAARLSDERLSRT
jgi:hypothetical protein